MIKVKIFIFFGIWLFSTSLKGQDKSIIVFKKFHKAGTTNGVIYGFMHPESFTGGIDTTNVNLNSELSLEGIESILKNARIRKHRQMKIADIRLAGKLPVDGEMHEFIICGNTLIIDLVASKNYWIIDEADQLKLNGLLQDVEMK